MGGMRVAIGAVEAGHRRYSGAAADWRRAAQFYERLGYQTGELATFEAGCHALLSRFAGMSGSGVSADDGRLEAENATAILRQLIAGGYHAPELKNESCLDPLRTRPDFQLLMMDAAFPVVPFAR